MEAKYKIKITVAAEKDLDGICNYIFINSVTSIIARNLYSNAN